MIIYFKGYAWIVLISQMQQQVINSQSFLTVASLKQHSLAPNVKLDQVINLPNYVWAK